MLRKLTFLPLKTHALLKNYLHNRKNKLIINGTTGPSFLSHTGVPQGSLLAPYLFGIFFADFLPSSPKSKIVKYADDSHVLIPIFKNVSQNSIISIIHEEIESATVWCHNNKQMLNANKIKILNIFFSPYGWTPLETDMYYSLFVENIKILGIIINHKLKWNNHTNQVIKIASQRFYAIRVLKNIMEGEEIKALYYALIRSLIEYGSPVFVVITNSLQSSLNRIQKRAHNIICGAKHCSCMEDLGSRKDRISLKLLNKINNSFCHLHTDRQF